MSKQPSLSPRLFNAAVIVASLGYFVDIFDLLLFSIVRKTSLASMGLDEAAQISQGLFLHNVQMTGMLIGGIIWGIWADKKGRLSVLFGSIALYSIGNLANAFVQDVTQYAVCRFISGIGLAGELGAGITLVAESLPKEKRGLGTTIVASVGVSGAVFGGLVAEIFDWRTTFLIGGALGFALLILRINTTESLLFSHAQNKNSVRGSFLSIFKKKDRLFRFIVSVLVGVPIWFTIGTLIQLAPEFAKSLGVAGLVTGGRAVMVSYAGLALGDLCSGAFSQWVGSRRRAIFISLVGLSLTILAYFTLGRGASSFNFYLICGFLGFFAGYWAVFVTVAAEQFGTNLRGTVAISVPNFVRASVIPMSLSFQYLQQYMIMTNAAAVVGTVAIAIALAANLMMQETFDKDLAYYEVD